MVLHTTWYTIAACLLGGLFIFTSISMLLFPQEMIPPILSGFEYDTLNLDLLQLTFLGNNIRNIVIGAFIIFFAFKDTKVLLILLLMRFFIEFLDLIGGFIYNPDIQSLIPIFIFILSLEGFLIYKGRQFVKKV
ncbi:MAG: hypothetical protein AAGC85_24205 [Bacteroidota bacterium]